jgi:hypothetical protein
MRRFIASHARALKEIAESDLRNKIKSPLSIEA